MAFLRAHATGLTIALTFAAIAALSLAPLPEALRPLPEVREQPWRETLLALVWPRGASRDEPAVPAPSTEAEPGDAAPPPGPVLGEKLRLLAPLGAVELAAAQEVDRLADELGARAVDLENPEALAGFFAALAATREGRATAPVRVVHFGDSLIASDHITDMIRRRLEVRFGSGGRGFLFVDRPSTYTGRKVRTGDASPGWEVTKIPEPPSADRIYGFSGVNFLAGAAPLTSRFSVRGARRAELFYVSLPNGGAAELELDGRALGRVELRGRLESASASLELPAGGETLTLTTRGPARLFGVALENGGPGVIYDSVGLPGAGFEYMLRQQEHAFADQLARRDPRLVVLMLGGNDVYRMTRGWTTAGEVHSSALALVERLRTAVPDAACLIIGPMSRAAPKLGGGARVLAQPARVNTVLRAAAKASGCGYWDMMAAMGGENAILRWKNAGLMLSDLIHPRGRGADVLGHLFDLALARAFAAHGEGSPTDAHGGGSPADALAPGIEDPNGRALDRVFAKLATLERQRQGRVGILQLGASHTAAHVFTDQARQLLSARFGSAGRGFVAAGQPSPRLARGKVERMLEGPWTVHDAVTGGAGTLWGLSGIRARGTAGSRLSIAFCAGCPSTSEPARVDLFYLESPAMGDLEVRLDGALVARLPNGRPLVSAARVLSLPTTGEAHTVGVSHSGGGAIDIFGAALELERPGLVFDALGLPGATVMVADAFDKPALAAQLTARHPDLYVLFYGTNESALPGLDAAAYRQSYGSLLATVRGAAPQADCLLIGPTDRMSLASDGRFAAAPSARIVDDTIRALARAEGCAYWSASAAMGGEGSIDRWARLDPPLAHSDRVHLSDAGYQGLSRRWVDDLLTAYGARREPGAISQGF